MVKDKWTHDCRPWYQFDVTCEPLVTARRGTDRFVCLEMEVDVRIRHNEHVQRMDDFCIWRVGKQRHDCRMNLFMGVGLYKTRSIGYGHRVQVRGIMCLFVYMRISGWLNTTTEECISYLP